jgi:glycine/D-amino acid oxidase-like deaminating enzyme
LTPVDTSPARIVGTIAGHRPFRPQGFRLESARVGRKVVVHNYGHGGCGVTLSWGTADRAANLACATEPRRVAVLGAGAVGLATARMLQERGVHVTIYARDLPPRTTSNVAGALWSPVTLVDEGRQTPAFAEELAQAARVAHRRFDRLTGERYGIRWVNFYLLSNDAAPPTSWEWSVTPELFQATTLAKGQHPFPTAFAHRYRLMSIDPSVYLPAVMADFTAANGRLVVQEIPTLQSLDRLDQEIVVNCTGLGARALFADHDLVPIKGQLTMLQPQVGVDYAVKSTLEDLYMFPRRESIVLGGSHQRGDRSLEVDPIEAERILAGHRRLFAAMAEPDPLP